MIGTKYKHDDDDKSVLSDGESTCDSSRQDSSQEQDDEKEIRMQTLTESNRVLLWKWMVFAALMATAVAVTWTSYSLLKKAEQDNFENVFSQFARTVSDAAVSQQKSLVLALKTLSETVSLSAHIAGNGNSLWPYYYPPMFEMLGKDFKKASRSEFVGLNNLVRDQDREAFINFSTSMYQDVVEEAHMIAHGHLKFLNNDTDKYNPFISQKTADGFIPDEQRPEYWVRTIQSPPPRAYGPQINWNVASTGSVGSSLEAILALRNETTLSEIRPFLGLPADEHKGFHSDDNADNPHSFAFFPIFEVPGDTESDIVGFITAAIAFDASLRNLLPKNVEGMLVVVSNTCNQTISYVIDGADAFFQDRDDLHNEKYDDMAVEVDLNVFSHPAFKTTPNHCLYSMTIYPTEDFENDYKTNTPAIFSAIVASVFLLVALVFLGYDYMVKSRNEKMIENAAQSNAMLSSVVPKHLKARLLSEQAKSKKDNSLASKRGSSRSLKTFLNDGSAGITYNPENEIVTGAPLADLFLDVTVLFADISGFTAWSSVREPTQVFILLETLYQAFDRIAKKRRIFKVETVGDCYVAVCGLPDPRKDHAVAMSRFAKEIIQKQQDLVKQLEVLLGPDTGDLSLRIGLHSGPVTAGVLRGDRSRFQLFGDTMNTCSRLESSGIPNMIQCSKATATQLIKQGKENWLRKRADTVTLKGLGAQETWWVDSDQFKSEKSSTTGDSSDFDLLKSLQVTSSSAPRLNSRTKRLVDWNVELLSRLLKEIEAIKRIAKQGKQLKSKEVSFDALQKSETPLEEVCEIIALAEFDSKASTVDPDTIKIPEEVTQNLRLLVTTVADMYNDNPFHNFDHASHVVMSVTKLLSRIVAPSSHLENIAEATNDVASKLHDHTYGITSDPLIHFSCAFSALIHDVDHQGVSNAQLVKEQLPLAADYKQRSVAEQNSLDLSWKLLGEPRFEALRAFLFTSEEDLIRFRQLVVNSVMATDIVDKDLKALRNARWEKAFKEGHCGQPVDQYQKDDVNRKATIVIEHIIQASDVSHTMQHWHVYRKWNQRLFEELYVAYLNGRADKDPAEFWAKGELGFFDFYIIPLTRKLKDCGVFGVSSDEYLNYALRNREEWETRGVDIVRGMVEECHRKYGLKDALPTVQLDFDV